MPLDNDDEYFPSPSTPVRHSQLKSPERINAFGSGSVSSSLIASPPKDRRDSGPGNQEKDDGDGEGDDPESEPTTPAVQQLRKATGFASVRVGLGSPSFTMKRTWTGNRTNDGELREEQSSGMPEASMRSRGLVNMDSGLPTPPGTDSDIGPPPPILQRTESHGSKTSVSGGQTSPPRPPRHPRRPSSQYLPALPDPDSPGPGSRTSSPHLRSSGSQRRGSPSISRSSSSSSVFAHGTIRNERIHYSPAEGSRIIQAHSPYDRYRSSPDRRASTDGDRREILNSPPPTLSRSGSVSPSKKSHQRSPSLPADPVHRRPAYRTTQSQESRCGREVIEEEDGDEYRQVRSPVGTSLDDRIRDAEEKIKRSNDRRPRTAGHETTPPISGATRRHDSYSRNSNSPSTHTTSTLRRSATLSSASAMTPSGGNASDSSIRRPGIVARLSGEDVHEREHSGGSGSSGRRKPIPDFRAGGLFTPPKPALTTIASGLPSSQSFPRLSQASGTPTYSARKEESPSSRFATASRLQNGHQYHETSPIDRFRPPRHVESRQSPRAESRFDQRPEESSHAPRGWNEPASFLLRAGEQDPRPSSSRQYDTTSVRRADSVLGTASDRHRYERRGGSVESALVNERQKSLQGSGRPSRISPRYALGPGDSVSVVGGSRREGAESTRKDPREVLKRMEEMRTQHRETWEAERSSSVMGEHTNWPLLRGSSRPFDSTTRHARPSTSMSAIRDAFIPPVPRTAPIEGWRARRDQVMAADSPLVGRGASRLGGLPKPATEPRPMRASTSMGSRMATTSLDFAVPNTEHGRLLFEACRALELKIGPDILAQVPELIKTIQSAARTSEHVNAALRDALEQVTNASVRLDMDDLEVSRREFASMEASVRDASKTSDQNVRELTRIMLDLPKLVRQAERVGVVPSRLGSGGGNRTSSPGQYDQSPVRASYDMMRPSTSLGEITSPTYRYSLDSRRPVLLPRSQAPGDQGRNNAVSNLVAKMKGLTPKRSPLPPQNSDLDTIEQSPPHQLTNRIPSMSTSQSRSSLTLSKSISPSKSSSSMSTSKSKTKSRSSIDRADVVPPPPPRSPDRPERRKVLRKKTSTTSTHTVRGTSSSAFMPTSSKVQTTTALSVINAGHRDRDSEFDFDESELTPAKSIRSTKTFSTSGTGTGAGSRAGNGSDEYEYEYASSPASGYSFAQAQTQYRAQDSPSARGSMESGSGSGTGEAGRTRPDDAVSILEHSLAAAAKKREGEERKPSVSERFRATLRRGSSIRAKE